MNPSQFRTTSLFNILNINSESKPCEVCAENFVPRNSQGRTQKYCSKRCKYRAQRQRDLISKSARGKKGGYPRASYIRLWMQARSEDQTAPCHYCGKRLNADNFCLDHKIPMKKLKTREEIMDENNLVVSCNECNLAKGSMDYYEFVSFVIIQSLSVWFYIFE